MQILKPFRSRHLSQKNGSQPFVTTFRRCFRCWTSQGALYYYVFFFLVYGKILPVGAIFRPTRGATQAAPLPPSFLWSTHSRYAQTLSLHKNAPYATHVPASTRHARCPDFTEEPPTFLRPGRWIFYPLRGGKSAFHYCGAVSAKAGLRAHAR